MNCPDYSKTLQELHAQSDALRRAFQLMATLSDAQDQAIQLGEYGIASDILDARMCLQARTGGEIFTRYAEKTTRFEKIKETLSKQEDA